MEEYKNISLHTLYKQLAPERIKTTIGQLELAPGTITKSQPAISDTVHKFYKSLYSPTPTDHNLQKFFLDHDLPTLEPQQITSIEKNDNHTRTFLHHKNKQDRQNARPRRFVNRILRYLLCTLTRPPSCSLELRIHDWHRELEFR